MSGQRKRRIREKDRERYTKKHQRQETANARDSSANITVSVISPNAVKQKAHRVKKHLPGSPNKFSQVLKHVVCNVHQEKRHASFRCICRCSAAVVRRTQEQTSAPMASGKTLLGIVAQEHKEGNWLEGYSEVSEHRLQLSQKVVS